MNQGTEWSITLEICLEWSCKDTFIPPRICRPSPKRTPSGSLHLFPERCITSEFVMSVQFSRTVVSDSLRPHEPQHARPPCPSPTPGIHPNPCPSSRWCHPTISSSVVPFSSCPQSFPASGSFPMSQLFASGSQSVGSLSFNISPSNEHPGLNSFRMDWLDLLAVQGLSRVCSNNTVQKHQFFRAQLPV